MKVIFICHFGYNLPSARVRCYKFAEELRKYGVETEVYSFYDRLNTDFTVPGDTKRVISNIKAYSRLSKEKNAILYVQKADYHFLTPFFMKWINNNKMVLDLDDWEHEVRSYRFIKSGWITNLMAKQSDMFITASAHLKKIYNKNPNTHILPTVPDHKLFAPSSGVMSKEECVFSWIGMVWGMPVFENIMFLLECFNELPDKNITLEIVGGGPFMQLVEKSLKTKFKNASARVSAFISPDKMPEYLNGIDVGLMPLIRKTKYNLCKSPTKLFEYMACGKPAICSKIGESQAWIIKDGVNGCLADSKEEFKEKIVLLAKNREVRKQMGMEARRFIEKNNIETTGKRLFELLKTL